MQDTPVAVLILIFLIQIPVIAQTSTAKSVLGTAPAFNFNKDAKTLDVNPDNGKPIPLKLMGNTAFSPDVVFNNGKLCKRV
jgi:hypothetical protein